MFHSCLKLHLKCDCCITAHTRIVTQNLQLTVLQEEKQTSASLTHFLSPFFTMWSLLSGEHAHNPTYLHQWTKVLQPCVGGCSINCWFKFRSEDQRRASHEFDFWLLLPPVFIQRTVQCLQWIAAPDWSWAEGQTEVWERGMGLMI